MWRLSFLAALILSLPQVHGAQIEKVKGKGVLINLEGETASQGDLYYSVDESGKKRGLIKINKVARGKAIGVLGKGKAQAGWMLEAKPKSSSGVTGGATARARTRPESQGGASRAYWGLMTGAVMDNISVDLVSDADGQPNGQSADLKGTTFALKGMFDYQLFDLIWFRGMSGIENLDASGKDTLGATRTAKIMYLSFDFWGRAVFGTGNIRPWAGGGFALMFPMSKESTALREASITNTSTMAVGFGADWFLSPTSYIPVSIEYGLFPESQLVKADYIALRFGYAMPF